MARLPEPDWITLFESVERAARAFGAELPAVESALVAAFHDQKIRTRGRFRPYFENKRLHDLPHSFWDRVHVRWQLNMFIIPSDQLDSKMYIVTDVDVCREDLEKWINGAMLDSQHGSQEAAETSSPKAPGEEKKPQARRSRDVEADANLTNRIEMVLAKARRRWPDPKKRPEIDVMAKELERLYGKELGYKFQTIRKILRGTYRSLVRLGIPGL